MIEATFEWAFRCNERRTLRQRLGHGLRMLAAIIDGRLSLAIDIETKPALSTTEKVECVAFGLGQIKRAVEVTTRTKAEELILDCVMKARCDAHH